MDLAEFTGSRKGPRKTGNDQNSANPDLVGAAGINIAASTASSVDIASAPPGGINVAASTASSINIASAPPGGINVAASSAGGINVAEPPADINVAPPPTWRLRRIPHCS